MQRTVPPLPPRLNRKLARIAPVTFACLLCTALTACGGGGSAGATGSPGGTTAGSGSPAGASGTGNGNLLNLSSPNATGTLEKLLPGTNFTVSITKQPVAQLCTVGQPGGTMGNVSSVDAITCTQGSGSLLYAFGSQSGDGSHPTGGLLEPGDGLLLGSTLNGAAGFGSIFEYQVGGSGSGIQLLHVFEGPPDDGAAPLYPPGPMAAQAGTYIGVTTEGGASNDGAIYTMLASNGATTLAASFIANSSGAGPNSPLLELNGSYFGTTYTGGSGQAGTFYEFTFGSAMVTGTVTPLADFDTGSLTLQHPAGRMVLASNGQIFGVAQGTTTGYVNTGGGVFAYSPGGGNMLTVCQFGSTTGPYEPSGGLAQAPNGDLYGVTVAGGVDQAGMVYRVDPASESCAGVYSFTNGTGDGSQPLGAPFLSRAGNLYVTSSAGGLYGDGALVELSPNGTLLGTLYQFGANGGPQVPVGAPIEDPATGYLYGVTQSGGANGLSNGTIYRID